MFWFLIFFVDLCYKNKNRDTGFVLTAMIFWVGSLGNVWKLQSWVTGNTILTFTTKETKKNASQTWKIA